MSQSTITCSRVSHRLTHAHFIPYTQFQSQFHDSNTTIYHANVVNLVQNTNKFYKSVSHNMGSETLQTISHLIVSQFTITCLHVSHKLTHVELYTYTQSQ